MNNYQFIGSMYEKKIGRGEDSDPILFVNMPISNFIAVGVFDGMGGAGSTECLSSFSVENNHKTKAYVASRIVRESISNLLINTSDFNQSPLSDTRLKEAILKTYTEERIKYPSISKGVLRSSLIKDYPTTLAITTAFEIDNEIIINSYWAGDSRNYLWTEEGIFQISNDDIKGDLDPFENLREDAPLSNCVHADGEFVINNRIITSFPINKRFIIMSATDGCFGYFQSPMDFEKVLYETLKISNSYKEWEENIIKVFKSVTADDFSFGLGIVGFSDFNALKKYFRYPVTSRKYTTRYYKKREHLDKETKRKEEKLSRLKKGVDHELVSSWFKYKQDFLKYLDIK